VGYDPFVQESFPLAAADDADLARRIRDAAPGIDGGAEEELCRRLVPRVRLYGRKHLRDSHAAEDLVQQVLVLTIERLRSGGLREPDRLVSFVLGVCRLTVLDLRRTMTRRERLLEAFGPDLPVSSPADAPVPGGGAGVFGSVGHGSEDLLGCLERLTERERSVLVMTFYDGRSAAEVASEFGLSEGNVRVIRHRSLAHLRSCLAAEGTTA
jgi:RNA polymerase sigma-70 factor (ECF subfamily)